MVNQSTKFYYVAVFFFKLENYYVAVYLTSNSYAGMCAPCWNFAKKNVISVSFVFEIRIKKLVQNYFVHRTPEGVSRAV
jgi:restriction endonuclease S subunit